MKRHLTALAILTAGILLWGGVSLAQTKQPACDKANTPQKIEGQVAKIDLQQGKMTVRGSDGKTHELQAEKETLHGYKVGDRIEAKLRSAPGCG